MSIITIIRRVRAHWCKPGAPVCSGPKARSYGNVQHEMVDTDYGFSDHLVLVIGSNCSWL